MHEFQLFFCIPTFIYISIISKISERIHFSPNRSSTWAVSASMGNSMSGPITNASAINGSPENAVTAMASAMGEFRAMVVMVRLTESA